jgi:hypothetical protein
VDETKGSGLPLGDNLRKPAAFRIWLWLALFLLAVIVIGIGTAIYVGVHRSPIPESAWRSFAPRGGGFEVQVPAAPQEPTEGSTAGCFGFIYEIPFGDDDGVITVEYYDRPSVSASPTLSEFTKADQQFWVEGAPATLAGENEIKLDKYPGWEYRLSHDNWKSTITRVYHVKTNKTDRFIVVRVVARGAQIKPIAARFFNSLRIDAE